MSKILLIVHHTPYPFTQAMFEAAPNRRTGRMFEADGYLLGTRANLAT